MTTATARTGFEEVEGDVIDPHDSAIQVLSPATKGEIDMQISTAKRYPRSIKSFKEQALAMATLDEETASGCFYSMPRGGKPIEGPSARLAEIVLSAWGNVRADARVIDAGPKEITAEAMTWDLEKNVAVRVQVKRRITDKHGKRYNDDMIVVTGNAACSIALRNSVFKVIPMAFTKAVYQAARAVAIGDAKTLASKRAEMVAYFGKMGIVPERVLAVIDRKSIEDVSLDDLAVLKGLATAIKEGDTSVDEAFPDPNAPKPGAKAADLNAKLKETATPTGNGAVKLPEFEGKPIDTPTGEVVGTESKTPPPEPVSNIGKAKLSEMLNLIGLATNEDDGPVARKMLCGFLASLNSEWITAAALDKVDCRGEANKALEAGVDWHSFS